MASYLLRTILCLNLVASVSYLVFKASAFAGRKHISEKWRYNCTTVIMFLYVIPFYKLLPAFPKTLAEAEPISVVGNKVVSGINVLPPENSVASITEASPNIIKDTTLNMSLDWQKWALIIWIVLLVPGSMDVLGSRSDTSSSSHRQFIMRCCKKLQVTVLQVLGSSKK